MLRPCGGPFEPLPRRRLPWPAARRGCRGISIRPGICTATPEVQDEIDRGRWSCALHHFLCNPTPQRYQGAGVVLRGVLRRDLPGRARCGADGAFRNTYEHFVRHGAAERRRPHAEVDLGAHFSSLRVQAEIERGDFATPSRTGWRSAPRRTPAARHRSPKRRASSCSPAWRSMLPQLARTRLDFTVHERGVSQRHHRAAQPVRAHHERAGLAARCYPGGIELILVDSGSRDETRRIGRYVIRRPDHPLRPQRRLRRVLQHRPRPRHRAGGALPEQRPDARHQVGAARPRAAAVRPAHRRGRRQVHPHQRAAAGGRLDHLARRLHLGLPARRRPGDARKPTSCATSISAPAPS